MDEAGQVTGTAAEVYDEFFVPALFGRWAPVLADRAGVDTGMHVVDVACGTGVLALEAAARVAPTGRVAGVDCNRGMLAVARRRSRHVTWVEAAAEALPFDSATVDVVVCQFGLMFFRDSHAAIAEMARVLKPGGRVGIAVWDALEEAPGYAAVVALLQRLFGDSVADLLRAPYRLGDRERVRNLIEHDRLDEVVVQRVPGVATFSSIRAWMHTEVRGWTLAGKIDETQFERLVLQAERDLERFVLEDGTVRFAHPAIVATARRSI